MTTLSLRTLVRNAAAVSSGCHGEVTRRAEQAGRSRQAVSDHARRIEERSQPPTPAAPPAEGPVSTSSPASLDEPTRRRLAVTPFALGISTRQIEDRLRVILADDAPDHSTIGRRVADEAARAEPVLEALDTASAPRIQAPALDEIFLGGGRPWSGSSRRA